MRWSRPGRSPCVVKPLSKNAKDLNPRRGRESDGSRGLVFDLQKLRHVAELGVARVEQLLDRALLQFREIFLQGSVKQQSGSFVVKMGSAFRLRNDAINAAQLFQILGRDAHGLRG